VKHLPDHQCRRCGAELEEVWQLIDPHGRWAVVSPRCECGHCWTVIRTAPVNLAAVRSWVRNGCRPVAGPITVVTQAPWQCVRLEGVSPASEAVAL